MEAQYYRKEKQRESHLDSEGPQDYKQEISPEYKENLFKEIYSNIALFKKLVYEAKKEKK